jgi:pyruvate dehydrogenase E1 component alpha subunit
MDKKEKADAIAADPVPRFRRWLIDNGHADEADLAAIDADMGRQIAAAIEQAIAAPFPDVAELRKDVFATEIVSA